MTRSMTVDHTQAIDRQPIATIALGSIQGFIGAPDHFLR
jgi:hypothetical protein